jgi:23S rRNA pseudouridine1911/1915/1917 synthase
MKRRYIVSKPPVIEAETALPVEAEGPDYELLDSDEDAPAGGNPSRSYLVTEVGNGERLDRFLVHATAATELSRTRLKALVDQGVVTIDGHPAAASTKLRAGQMVTLVLPEPEDPIPQGENIPLNVVFEDDHLLIVDKPAGLVVHPAAGHQTGTLVNALIGHCGDSLSGIGGVRRPGIVHRLDKDTSGLLVVAKTNAAHRGLTKLFADHGRTLPLNRTYLALVWGAPERPNGTIEAALGRHATDRQKMAVVPDERGRHAVTHWEILESYFVPDRPAPIASLVACMLETGRTHQIRVHMAHLGHPVLGDPLYARGFKTKEALLGPKARASLETLGRQALHAAVLGFPHPVTHVEIERESELPQDIEALRAALEAGL